MRRNILKLFSLYIIFLNSLFFASDFRIKSLRIYSANDQSSFPVIYFSDLNESKIQIEFDLEGSFIPNLNIVFKLCDKNWMPYENAFLANIGKNTEYNLWISRLPLRVKGAQYHYQGVFPNQNVSFPYSGKWKFFIVDPHNKNKIYGEGKFYVVYPEVKLSASIEKLRSQYSNQELAILGRSIGISTSFILPDSLYSFYVKGIEIVENYKIPHSIFIDRENQSQDKFFEWNGSNRFTFVVQNLRPGNEYRQIDLTDINFYNQQNVNAHYNGIETSNLFKQNFRDFNGGSYLVDYFDEYSEYMNVNFRIRTPENVINPIFLVGSFNNWEVQPEYELFDDDGLLNLRIELKRGIYDYVYVTGEIVNDQIKNIDWNILEGNFWETKNEYNIFLYYASQEKGGYDKIIGYLKINSGEQWRN